MARRAWDDVEVKDHLDRQVAKLEADRAAAAEDAASHRDRATRRRAARFVEWSDGVLVRMKLERDRYRLRLEGLG